MLSLQNTTSNMQTRQQHRRQHSTPVAFEAPSSDIAPAHRRGMTVPSATGAHGLPLQEPNTMVGMTTTTNPGHPTQHYMQVTHSAAQAQPGHPQPFQMARPVQAQISAEEYRRLQHKLLDEQLDFSEQQLMFNMTSLDMERSRSNPERYNGMGMAALPASQGHQQLRPGSSRSEGPTFEFLHHHGHNGIVQRPLTPPNQDNSGYTPITPSATPRFVPIEQFDAIDSASVTKLIATPQQHSRDGSVETIESALPSPPRTVTVKQGRTFDVVTVPAVSLATAPRLDLEANVQGAATYLVPQNSADLIDYGSPESYSYESQYGSPMRAQGSGKGLPIDELSLEATIEDTGVTSEEVQSYIEEPSDADAKWTCLYPDCGKKFGRKENIRSHVQTHLGDRQFKCIHCSKCFVRQHDLKRHSKIHSGVKPYLCRCGADFARHDALTRHRTRGVCIGAFEGVVKKYAKRGRPKKENRPDDDDRYNKAARTQRRVAARAAADASSVSGTDYNSSWPASPEEMLRASVELGSPQFSGGRLEEQQVAPDHIEQQQILSLAPSAFSVTPPHSPSCSVQYSSPQKTPLTQHGAPSPAASEVEAQTGKEAQAATSRLKIAASEPDSQAGSPPELSHSSPPSSTQMLDFDFSSSGTNMAGMGCEGGFDGRDFNMFDTTHDDLFVEQWGSDNTFFSFDKASTGVRMDSDDFGNELNMF